jgi:hypothetical protein
MLYSIQKSHEKKAFNDIVYSNNHLSGVLKTTFSNLASILSGIKIQNTKFDPISIIKEILQDIKNGFLFVVFLLGLFSMAFINAILTVVCYFFQFIHLPLEFCYA